MSSVTMMLKNLPILPLGWLFRDQIQRQWSLQRMSSVTMMMKIIFLSCPEMRLAVQRPNTETVESAKEDGEDEDHLFPFFEPETGSSETSSEGYLVNDDIINSVPKIFNFNHIVLIFSKSC